MVLFVCSVEGGVALRASTNYQDRIGGIRGPDYGDQIDVDVVDNEWLRLLLPDRPAAWNSTAFLPRYNFFHGAPVYFREARPLYPDVGGTVNWACQRRAGDDDIMYRNSTFRFDRFEASVGLTAGGTALHGPERRRFAFPPLDGYTTFAAEQEGEWLHLTAPRYDNFYVPLLSETGAGPPLCFPRLALPPSPPSIPSPPSPPAPPSPPSPPAAPPSYPYGVALTPLYVEAERMAMVAVISSILTLFAAACCLHYRTRKRMANLLVSRDRAKMDLALVEHQAKTTIELGSLQPQDEEEASALASLSDMHAPPSSSVFPSLPPGPPSSGSGWGGDEDRLTPGRNPIPGLVRSRAQWVPLQGGGGGGGNPTSAASEARIEANVEPRLRSLYEAILSALQQPTWEAARPSLLPIIKVTAVGSEAAEKLEVAVKQMYVLARMHGRIEPERAYEKLSATCDELPAPIRVAIHGHLSRNVLTYGAVQSTIEGGLSLAPSDACAARSLQMAKRRKTHSHGAADDAVLTRRSGLPDRSRRREGAIRSRIRGRGGDQPRTQACGGRNAARAAQARRRLHPAQPSDHQGPCGQGRERRRGGRDSIIRGRRSDADRSPPSTRSQSLASTRVQAPQERPPPLAPRVRATRERSIDASRSWARGRLRSSGRLSSSPSGRASASRRG